MAAERQSGAVSQLLSGAAAASATVPPSNLTPSLAQAQSYSAAQQVRLHVRRIAVGMQVWTV